MISGMTRKLVRTPSKFIAGFVGVEVSGVRAPPPEAASGRRGEGSSGDTHQRGGRAAAAAGAGGGQCSRRKRPRDDGGAGSARLLVFRHCDRSAAVASPDFPLIAVASGV